MGVKNTGCAHISFRNKNYGSNKVGDKVKGIKDLDNQKKDEVEIKSKFFNLNNWVNGNEN